MHALVWIQAFGLCSEDSLLLEVFLHQDIQMLQPAPEKKKKKKVHGLVSSTFCYYFSSHVLWTVVLFALR